ncbi:MAG TPA: response regulator, partial [Kofleriaceae bacterium]|nr:response regulator [Kofleriaceae bacterium]
IVHRDLSPKNVLISLQGDAKILDFGVAKGAIARDDDEGLEIKGNPSYLSPEQARLELVDRRSDVFTLGVLLWELTCGRRLFQVADPLHALEVIGRVPIPSPAEFRPVPPGWEGVLRRALAPRREDRYPTARALQLDIEDVARSAGTLVSNLPVVATLAALFPEVALEIEPQPERRARRPSVLVVDDEPHMVDLVTRTLRRAFDVRGATSVPEALAALAAQPFDAVLSDERMPDGRGIDLLTHVARESARTVRVMITAHADTDLMLQAINDGRVNRFVVKPFRPLDLLALVEQALAERPALAEDDAPGAAPAGAALALGRRATTEVDPAEAVPAGAVPAGAVPAEAVPAGAVPAGAVPAEAVDDGAVTAVAGLRRAGAPAPAVAVAALPWESLRHLAAPAREGALSALLMVGIADQLLGEDVRAALAWVVGDRLDSSWVHVEGRAVAVVLPGLAAAAGMALARALADATESLSGASLVLAIDELRAGDDLAEVGRRVELRAVEAWRAERAP